VGLRIKADDPSHKLWFCIAPKGKKGKRTEQIEFKGFPKDKIRTGVPLASPYGVPVGTVLDSPDHSQGRIQMIEHVQIVMLLPRTPCGSQLLPDKTMKNYSFPSQET
jgi:hypothetical protein